MIFRVRLFGAVDAAAVAGAGLDEAVVDAPLADLFQQLDDVFRALHAEEGILVEDVGIFGEVGADVFHDALEYRVDRRRAGVVAKVALGAFFKLDVLFYEPAGKLFEGDDAVDEAFFRDARLLYLRDAGGEKDDQRVVAVLFAEEFAVGLHRG
ncbi:hypothetical protein SDC9_179343 [bioreactor metagenome]|uniref:Uncharacterized protein n=1 Tax=bioreactor metagenome TaxID=1076179 RepID=A0A645GYQ6_9ZZZZ